MYFVGTSRLTKNHRVFLYPAISARYVRRRRLKRPNDGEKENMPQETIESYGSITSSFLDEGKKVPNIEVEHELRRYRSTGSSIDQFPRTYANGNSYSAAPDLGKMYFTRLVRPHTMFQGKLDREIVRVLRKVLRSRTTPQLKSSFKSYLEKVDIVRGGISYNRTCVGFEHKPTSVETGKDSKIPVQEKAFVYGPNETFGYISHRFIPAFSICRRVLAETKALLPGFEPQSQFDFGSGPGTAVFASRSAWGLDVSEGKTDMMSVENSDTGSFRSDGSSIFNSGSDLNDTDVGIEDESKCTDRNQRLSNTSSENTLGREERYRRTLSEVRMVEISRSMRDAADSLMIHLPSRGVKMSTSSNLVDACDAALVQSKTYHLVTATYSISELPNNEQRAAAAALLWRLVEPNGVLVVVEHGDARGSHVVRSVRQAILDRTEGFLSGRRDEYVQEGGKRLRKEPAGNPRVLAPCTHDRRCPIGEQDKLGVCRFYHQVPRMSQVLKENSALKNEAFSYVVIQKSDERSEKSSVGEMLNPVSLLRSAMSVVDTSDKTHSYIEDDLECDSDDIGDDEIPTQMLRSEWSRIIRNPSKAKQHVSLQLCAPTGEVNDVTIIKRCWKEAPGLFTAARKAKIGGLWPWLPELFMKDRTSPGDVLPNDIDSSDEGELHMVNEIENK